MSEQKKQFKIIKIINKYNVIIDAGSNDGITSDSKFAVIVKGKEVVYDNINYGTLDITKATLEIKELYPKMCLCQSDKIVKTSTILRSLRTVEEVAPLPILSSQEDREFDYVTNSILKVGDTVTLL